MWCVDKTAGTSPAAYPLTITSDGEDEDGQTGVHSGGKPGRTTSIRHALQVSQTLLPHRLHIPTCHIDMNERGCNTCLRLALWVSDPSSASLVSPYMTH